MTGRLSAFVEYGYYDFGTERIRLTPQFAFLPTAFVDIDDTANVVRAGVKVFRKQAGRHFPMAARFLLTR